ASAKPQTPTHPTNQSQKMICGKFWLHHLVILWTMGMSASSPTKYANNHCISYATKYMKIGESIVYQAVPSPPQALPVAVYQVAPSATYQILDQHLYPLLCLNISCFPHGDYYSRRCSWEVAVGDGECQQYSSNGSIPLLRNGEDSYMVGPDPANYPIISHMEGDVFVSLNGREKIKLATVGDVKYVRLLNVSDMRSYVKFLNIDIIKMDSHCLVLNPCTANGFEPVPWYLSMRQGDMLYLKSFPNEKTKISVYNMCTKKWAHGTGDSPSLLSIPSNSWQQIEIKLTKNSTEIAVPGQVYNQYKFQYSENECDESVYTIAVAGASFSLSCEVNATTPERVTSAERQNPHTFQQGSSPLQTSPNSPHNLSTPAPSATPSPQDPTLAPPSASPTPPSRTPYPEASPPPFINNLIPATVAVTLLAHAPFPAPTTQPPNALSPVMSLPPTHTPSYSNSTSPFPLPSPIASSASFHPFTSPTPLSPSYLAMDNFTAASNAIPTDPVTIISTTSSLIHQTELHSSASPPLSYHPSQ
ncbi:unnamed protein product, partial [Meganyctiphanes norvegica]